MDILQREGWSLPLFVAIAQVAVLPMVFAAVLGAYWDAYDIAPLTSGFAAFRLARTLAFVTFVPTLLAALSLADRRGLDGWPRTAACTGALACVFLLLLVLEVWRTAPEPGARLAELAGALVRRLAAALP